MRGRFRVNITAAIVIRTATRCRCGGGPANMMIHPVNWSVGVPGVAGIGGSPGLTGTESRGSIGRTGMGSLRAAGLSLLRETISAQVEAHDS